MKSFIQRHRKSLCKVGELLVLGGVAAEFAAGHLCSQIGAIFPSAAPDSAAVCLWGEIGLLVGLILELAAADRPHPELSAKI